MNDNVECFLESKACGTFDSFVQDKDSHLLSKIQECEFLNNCTKPNVGQHVDVCTLMSRICLAAQSFYLSGEVTEVKAPPLESINPMEHCGDKRTGKGSMGMSGALLPY
jgi:hypothetical protein